LREKADQSGQQWERRKLRIGPLSDHETRELAYRLLGRVGDGKGQLAEMIVRESGGSPFFVRELVQYLQAADETRLSGEVDLEQVLWSRVSDLPSLTRRLLETVAVAGRPTCQHEIFEAAELEVSYGSAFL